MLYFVANSSISLHNILTKLSDINNYRTAIMFLSRKFAYLVELQEKME